MCVFNVLEYSLKNMHRILFMIFQNILHISFLYKSTFYIYQEKRKNKQELLEI